MTRKGRLTKVEKVENEKDTEEKYQRKKRN